MFDDSGVDTGEEVMIQMRADPRVFAKGLEKARKAVAKLDELIATICETELARVGKAGGEAGKRFRTVCEKRTRGGDAQ